MECPNCKNRLEFKSPVFENVGVYGKPRIGLTLCCNVMLEVSRATSFSTIIIDALEDDWCNKA
jgi:hypothetical protein